MYLCSLIPVSYTHLDVYKRQTPYFAYHIIDDVAHWEYDETTGQGNWPEGDLLCFEYVCCNETNAEENAEKHKQHAHLSLFLVHFLVFYEVYQALELIIARMGTIHWCENGCKITTFLPICQIFMKISSINDDNICKKIPSTITSTWDEIYC